MGDGRWEIEKFKSCGKPGLEGRISRIRISTWVICSVDLIWWGYLREKVPR